MSDTSAVPEAHTHLDGTRHMHHDGHVPHEHMPEPEQPVEMRPTLCSAAAPLALNGGGFIGCDLPMHHEGTHHADLTWGMIHDGSHPMPPAPTEGTPG